MKDTLVLKYGSDSVTDGNGMDQARVNGYAEQLVELQDRYRLVVVTSGAVAVGRWRWQQAGNDPEDGDKQVLASLGSAGANIAWEQAFDLAGRLAGQGLVTHREINDRHEGGSLLKALGKMLDSNVIPVINENDLLSDKELKKLAYGGDNDGLSQHITVRLGAVGLFLLTNVDGLKTNLQGTLYEDGVIPVVNFNEAEHSNALRLARSGLGVDTGIGTGDMESKVEAAIRTVQAGIDAYIARAGEPIDRIMSGDAGTHFVAKAA